VSNTRWSFRRRPLKIFISYRREDSVDSAGRLYSDLKLYFNRPFRNLGRKVIVVRDFDSIPSGTNWKERIENEIKASAAFITVIGNQWLNIPNPKTGQRRLDDPKDTHRVEIETALSLAIPIFPVLVEGASMPGEEDLPEKLKKLASQNATSINDPGWDAKVEALIEDLELVLGPQTSSLGKFRGIIFLIFLLGVLSVWGINKYRNCCADNTNTSVPDSTPNTNNTPLAVTNTSPATTPVMITSSPSPTTAATPTVTPSAAPTPSIAGSIWEYETIGNSGKPVYGVVISFDATGSYIFRCVNKPSYPHKCLNENWIESKYAVHERRWELKGNQITIFWNRGTAEEAIDVGEITGSGTQMSGTGQDTARKSPEYSWSATKRN
jgi:TIR domain